MIRVLAEGRETEYTPKFHNKDTLQVLPNLEIALTTAKASASDVLFLDRFCNKTSERVWQIDLQKTLQALENSVDLERIITFLSDKNNGALPQPVQTFFDDVKNRMSKVRDFGEARILKCKDKAFAQLIANDKGLKKICVWPGENYIIVQKDNEGSFRKGLRKMGYVLSR